MNKVEGLASLQGRSGVRKPRFAQDLNTPTPQMPSLAPQAQGTNRYRGVPQGSQDDKMGQLADALGVAGATVAKREENKDREFMARKPAYIQQIREDRGNGLITAVQVGELFPEIPKSLQWRIAEAMGRDWGKERAQAIALEIENDENLQYNTGARQEYIEQRRADFFEEAGGDNDFWHGGAMSSFNKAMETWDHRWLERTANYHKQLSITQFKDEVTERFLHLGPQGLLDLDQEWSESGPLHHNTRNAAVVEAAIEIASEQGPEILDHIPDRFLNRQTKEKLREARAGIEQARIQGMKQAVWVEEQERKQEQRAIKVGILTRLGENPADVPSFAEYADHPELRGFIDSVIASGGVTGPESRRWMRSLRRQILVGASTGDFSHLGISGEDFNEEGLMERILYDPNMRPDDRIALMNEMDTLMDGITILRDPDVMRVFDTQVGPDISALLGDRSIQERLSRRLGGKSLGNEATRMYHEGVRDRVMDFMENEKRWPLGFEKYPMLQAAADEVGQWIAVTSRPGGTAVGNDRTPRTPTQPRRAQEMMQGGGR